MDVVAVGRGAPAPPHHTCNPCTTPTPQVQPPPAYCDGYTYVREQVWCGARHTCAREELHPPSGAMTYAAVRMAIFEVKDPTPPGPNAGPPRERIEATLTRVDLPFWHLTWFLVRLSFASALAVVLTSVLWIAIGVGLAAVAIPIGAWFKSDAEPGPAADVLPDDDPCAWVPVQMMDGSITGRRRANSTDIALCRKGEALPSIAVEAPPAPAEEPTPKPRARHAAPDEPDPYVERAARERAGAAALMGGQRDALDKLQEYAAQKPKPTGGP